MNEFEQFKRVLELFEESAFPNAIKKEHNFFEITGYPRYENVMSNVLRFFFDTFEEHNFRDMWLRSLLESYNEHSLNKIDTSFIETKNIEREYSNGTEKRIDLLIDARPLLIIIENKIDAGVNNPFEIYTKMAERYAGDNNIGDYELVKILLSVSEEFLEDKTGFVNITYEELFEKLDMNWPNYQPVQRWELFAKEFISNLRRKKENTSMEVDKKWLDFVKESGASLANLYSKIDDNINERVSILRKINDNLNELNNRKGVYNSKNDTYVSQYVDIPVKGGFNVCVETYMMKYGTKNANENDYEEYDKLYIALWCRRNRHYDFAFILKALNKENALKRETKSTGSWGEHYILDVYRLTDSLNIDEISEKIKQYVQIINKLKKE